MTLLELAERWEKAATQRAANGSYILSGHERAVYATCAKDLRWWLKAGNEPSPAYEEALVNFATTLDTMGQADTETLKAAGHTLLVDLGRA